MTNLVFPEFGRDERIAEDASMWFTPADVADRLARWGGLRLADARILEPSAGGGALVEAVARLLTLDQFNVTAFEIDPLYAERLRVRFPGSWIHQADYLAAAPPILRYDLALMNPPFEGGADGRFVAKAMDESNRVSALVRLAFLAGKARHEAVWSRCQPDGDFVFRRLAVFSKRPTFVSGRAIGEREDSGSAKADFCAIHLSRRAEHERGIYIPTHVEWW